MNTLVSQIHFRQPTSMWYIFQEQQECWYSTYTPRSWIMTHYVLLNTGTATTCIMHENDYIHHALIATKESLPGPWCVCEDWAMGSCVWSIILGCSQRLKSTGRESFPSVSLQLSNHFTACCSSSRTELRPYSVARSQGPACWISHELKLTKDPGTGLQFFLSLLNWRESASPPWSSKLPSHRLRKMHG